MDQKLLLQRRDSAETVLTAFDVRGVAFSANPTPLAGYTSHAGSVLHPASECLTSDDGGDVASVQGRRGAPLWYGAIVHQVAHRRHGVVGAELMAYNPAITVLDELRVEAAHVRERPQDAKYLALYAAHTTPPPAHGGLWALGLYATLMLGRVEAGVFHEDVVSALRSEMTLVLGAAKMRSLRTVWQQAVVASSAPQMEAAATGLLRRLPTVRRERYGVCGDVPGAGLVGPGEFEDLDKPDVPAGVADAVATLRGLAPEQVFDASSHQVAQQQRQLAAARVRAERLERRRAVQKARKKARFDNNAADEQAKNPASAEDAAGADAGLDDAGMGGDMPQRQAPKQEGGDDAQVRRSRARADVVVRDPDDADVRFARDLARSLKKAKERERGRVKVRQGLPPGRLSGRELILREVQVGRRQPVTARPFVVARSTWTPEPPLTVGLMVDTSGSMAWARSMVGRFTWAMAQAAREVDAVFAACTFGSPVQLRIGPGRPPRRVQEYAASGGRERFKRGFETVDGVLDLRGQRGARLLIVVSDGEYEQQEVRAARQIVRALTRHGVRVLWVGARTVSARVVPPEAELVMMEPVGSLPQRLGEALAQSLRDASA